MSFSAKENKSEVCIVMLNWNSYEDSAACLNSLANATYPYLKIVVVDNASTDGSARRLTAEFPNITLVQNDSNLGFSAGTNVGIRHALANNPDYILLLNNDTVVKEDFLEAAIEFAESHPNVGLVGGKVYTYVEKQRIWDAGGEIDWLRGRGKRVGWGEYDRGQYDEIRWTTFVTGCMMLIRREVIDRVGLLPEEYFFGVEAWDYSVQVKRAGYKLAYVPEFVIWHKVGMAHEELAPKWVYCHMRSRLLFMRRNAPRIWYLAWLFMMWLHSFYKRYVQVHSFAPRKVKEMRQAIKLVYSDHLKKDKVAKEDLEQF